MRSRSFGLTGTKELKKFLKLLDFCRGLELRGRCGKIAGGTPALRFLHFEKRGSLSAIFSLRCVPNRLDCHSLSTHPVQHHKGSTTDDQFPNAGLRSRVPQIWVISQGFDDGNDADGQSFYRSRLVLGDVSADFLKSCAC
jgi:hypothetical protein